MGSGLKKRDAKLSFKKILAWKRNDESNAAPVGDMYGAKMRASNGRG